MKVISHQELRCAEWSGVEVSGVDMRCVDYTYKPILLL